MATTIKSSALDFYNIKNNLKVYLANQDEFKDYNFEASGLSNILDVLAYNTHINALTANFALNESYLGTAQLRSSLVSLAEGLGYVPDTDTASQAIVNISFTSDAAGRPVTVELPTYTQFTAEVDDITYTFQTLDTYTATDDGTGFYEFKNVDGSNELSVYEGTLKTKTFLVGEYQESPVYIIPDKNLDADTVVVRVYDAPVGGNITVYSNILDATTITANSTVYILKESPNEFFELSFGDGITFGIAPQAGYRIVVQYLSTKGAPANTAAVFTPKLVYNNDVISSPLTINTVIASVGGGTKESIESIRKNAPFQYAAQNRMVTAADYSSLILRNYSTLIRDIKAWGGEDNIDPEFGAIYVSIFFEDDVTERTRAATKLSILDLAEQLAIISFRLRFTDPVVTYVEVENYFQFNPKLTTLTLNTIQSQVLTAMENYFVINTGGFEQAFRRSNLLTELDAVSQAILSTRANIKMQQRFTPSRPLIYNTINTLTNYTAPTSVISDVIKFINRGRYNQAASALADYSTSSYTAIREALLALSTNNNISLKFPAAIAQQDDRNLVITSTQFTYNGTLCRIQNRLSSRSDLGTILQVVDIATLVPVVDNIGYFDPNSGDVRITSFTPTAISGGVDYIKLSAVPANESAVAPTRNNIITFDRAASSARGVIVNATN